MLGGYAAVPCAIGAILWRVPMVVMEQNARAGAANRLAGRFAKAAAVPFADTDLPRAVVTGNPVRPEILAVDRAARSATPARAQLGLPPDRVVLAVFSGSLGSRRINEAVDGLAERWADRSRPGHPPRRRRPRLGRSPERRRPDRSPADGDRAAASATTGSATRTACPRCWPPPTWRSAGPAGRRSPSSPVVGLGAILVPLPIATRDHQTANAAALVRAGAAVVVRRRPSSTPTGSRPS